MGDDYPKLIIIFDGVCNLCSRNVQFILRHDCRRTFELATAQSTVGRTLLSDHGLDPDKLETLVLLKNGEAIGSMQIAKIICDISICIETLPQLELLE